MRLPRDISGRELAASLVRLGYAVDHQTGSHIRMTTDRNGIHHVTIPAHSPLRVGTLSAILHDVAAHLGMERDDLLRGLFS